MGNENLSRLEQAAKYGGVGGVEAEALKMIAENREMPWREACGSYHHDEAPCHVCNPGAMKPSKPQAPLSLMITGIQPRMILSGNIETIFDEVAKPNVVYDFTVSLTSAQILALMDWMSKANLLKAANDSINEGGGTIPAQLMIEYLEAVKRLLA